MKTKTKTNSTKTEASVTTKAKLTIQGQTFEMDLKELEHIYGVIGEALGRKKDRPHLPDEYKKLIEDEAKKHRDKFPPQIWPAQPFIPPVNIPDERPFRGPTHPPYEVWCSVDTDPSLKTAMTTHDRPVRHPCHSLSGSPA